MFLLYPQLSHSKEIFLIIPPCYSHYWWLFCLNTYVNMVSVVAVCKKAKYSLLGLCLLLLNKWLSWIIYETTFPFEASFIWTDFVQFAFRLELSSASFRPKMVFHIPGTCSGIQLCKRDLFLILTRSCMTEPRKHFWIQAWWKLARFRMVLNYSISPFSEKMFCQCCSKTFWPQCFGLFDVPAQPYCTGNVWSWEWDQGKTLGLVSSVS